MEPDLDISFFGMACIFERVVDEIEYQLGDAVTIELHGGKSVVEIEFETESFAIASGDTILFTLSRASDAYGGDLFLLRQRGVLVAGS